ncbi:uncharacterized protein LOC142334814 [Convolutriloba macropyga]|uniref:uncharacterized protein LOC142334814 n=1 Tax=Convolutriloba macropyga TaxID=536237 RepID=UPI003F51F2A5
MRTYTSSDGEGTSSFSLQSNSKCLSDSIGFNCTVTITALSDVTSFSFHVEMFLFDEQIEFGQPCPGTSAITAPQLETTSFSGASTIPASPVEITFSQGTTIIPPPLLQTTVFPGATTIPAPPVETTVSQGTTIIPELKTAVFPGLSTIPEPPIETTASQGTTIILAPPLQTTVFPGASSLPATPSPTTYFRGALTVPAPPLQTSVIPGASTTPAPRLQTILIPGNCNGNEAVDANNCATVIEALAKNCSDVKFAVTQALWRNCLKLAQK